MPDLLEDTRRAIGERLKELRPHVEEHRRLQAAVDALEGVAHSTAETAARGGHAAAKAITSIPAKRPGRPKKSVIEQAADKVASAANKPRGRGRRKGSGTRAAETLALIKEHPGITIAELAERMGIKQNYLYRVLPALEKARKVHKQGKGWHPRRK